MQILVKIELKISHNFMALQKFAKNLSYFKRAFIGRGNTIISSRKDEDRRQIEIQISEVKQEDI